MKINIVGCGLSGIVCAIKLKAAGHTVEIFESRPHLGGNCYDEKIGNTMVHMYGPHIFHTDDEEVFSFLSQYTDWTPFQYKPKGVTELGTISLPYSKKTIAELGRELTEEEIIRYIFKDYSEKQWGVGIEKIPLSIINRIPKVAKYEDPTWFEGQKYQCLPKFGYTNMMKNMLEGITYHLGVEKNEWKKIPADLVIYTGKIDEYYGNVYGKLPYRSLKFKHTSSDSRLDNCVYNQNTKSVAYTRKYDHGYFTYDHSGSTIITEEYPIEHTEANIPFYPLPFDEPKGLYAKYIDLATKEKNTVFCGRLATYRYLDMWQTVRYAIDDMKKI